jgi:protein-tyrosine phosphatase
VQDISDLAVLRPHLAAQEAPDILDPIGQNAEYFSVICAHITELLLPMLKVCQPN